MVHIKICKQVAVTCKQATLAIARSTFTVPPPGDSYYKIAIQDSLGFVGQVAL